MNINNYVIIPAYFHASFIYVLYYVRILTYI